MAVYAEDTSVPVAKRRMNIDMLLRRYGAKDLMFQSRDSERAQLIGFTMKGFDVRMVFREPDPTDNQYTLTDTGRTRSPAQQLAAYQQAVRSMWAAVELIVKAKLEGIERGVTSFESEFLGDIVMSNGTTMNEMIETRRLSGQSGMRLLES